MTWGLATERRAQEAYIKHCKSAGKVVQLSPVGCPYFPCIHTSVLVAMNGFASMATVLVCMFEVKCPFSLDNEDVTTLRTPCDSGRQSQVHFGKASGTA